LISAGARSGERVGARLDLTGAGLAPKDGLHRPYPRGDSLAYEIKGQAIPMIRRSLALLCRAALVASLLSPLGARATAAEETRITVFAAASLMTALDEVARAYEAQSDSKITLSFAGSSTLAQQIRLGAPADLFISANAAWMDRIDAEDRIARGTRFDLLGNQMVLIAPAGHAPVTIDENLDLESLLKGGRLAMALVNAVPAGIYGQAALEHFGLWDSIAPQVAQTDNVRAALALVAAGAAPLGITYATDAAADPRVTVIATFPVAAHPAITYPAAALNDRPDTLDFLAYLRSAAADAVFMRHGFSRAEQ